MPGSMQTVGGKVNISRATFTRPNDTNTYTIGDVVAGSTSAATVLTFDSVAAYSGGSGIVRTVTLIDGANQATKLNADLFLFDTAPASYGNDQDPFTPTDAELLRCIGVATFSASTWSAGDLTSGANGNALQVATVNLPFKCKNDTSKLYGVLVARNAYVAIALSPFYINLHVEQD